MLYGLIVRTFTIIKDVTTRTTVSGQQNLPDGACIVVANHVNLLDSPILGISLGRKVRFMAKEELFNNDVIAFFTRQFGGFPVGKGRLDRRAGKTALEVLARGETLVIFPEGKRSPDGKLGPAYGGAGLLALKTGTPIVPVGITGTSRMVGKTWFLRRPHINIKIGEPFTLTYYGDTLTREVSRELSIKVMQHIAAQLPEKYRGPYGNDLAK